MNIMIIIIITYMFVYYITALCGARGACRVVALRDLLRSRAVLLLLQLSLSLSIYIYIHMINVIYVYIYIYIY